MSQQIFAVILIAKQIEHILNKKNHNYNFARFEMLIQNLLGHPVDVQSFLQHCIFAEIEAESSYVSNEAVELNHVIKTF